MFIELKNRPKTKRKLNGGFKNIKVSDKLLSRIYQKELRIRAFLHYSLVEWKGSYWNLDKDHFKKVLTNYDNTFPYKFYACFIKQYYLNLYIYISKKSFSIYFEVADYDSKIKN